MSSGEASSKGGASGADDADLRRLAEDISDAVDIDWSRLPSSDQSLLDDLRLIADVATALRTVGEDGARPRPGFVWGPLQVYERVGDGAFGEVYRAWDPRLEIEVALKLVRTDRADEPGDGRVLLTEARRLARVRHPHVVAVRGVDVHDGRLGLWTDFVSGRSLEEALAAGVPLGIDDAVEVGAGLAEAVAAVHDAGFVHGDIKGANVIRDDDGVVFLADFGAAVRQGSAPLASVMATPLCMAPELFRGDPPTVASDIYALGALCFRLLTAHHVVGGTSFESIQRQHRLLERAHLRDLRPDAPAPLVRTLERALAARPEDRFSDMVALSRALRASARPDHNLPSSRTSFFGRDEERQRVAALLASGRVVTLTGVGGAGKTRLALEVASETLGRFADGARLIELEGVDAGEVEATISRVLNVGGASTGLAAIVGCLRDGAYLLLIDNAEHVLDEVTKLVDALLDAAPQVAMLVTSRERLGVAGETVHVVLPLRTPADGDLHDPSELIGNPSVALFCDRARAADSRFELTVENAPHVASICRQLDGIPLALELAAGSLQIASLGDLVRSLGNGPLDALTSSARTSSALTSSARTTPERHRTVESMLDWSFGLLDDAQHSVFLQLSVFQGGFTVAAAASVCAAAESPLSEDSFERTLSALVQKSLVFRDNPVEADATFSGWTPELGAASAERSSEMAATSLNVSKAVERRDRYRLLDTVRRFAAERLGGHAATPNAHLAYYAGLVTSARESQTALSPALMRSEAPNFRAAIRHALASNKPDDAALIARAIGETWRRQGRYLDALAVYRALWERRGEVSDRELLVELASDAATCCDHLEWHDEAERFLDSAYDMVRAGEVDPSHETRIVSNLGGVAMGRRDYALCTRLFERALELARKHKQARSESVDLGNLGIMLRYEGDLERSDQCFAAAERIAREIGLERDLGMNFFHRAYNALYRSQIADAIRLCLDSVRMHRRTGDLRELALALTLLGRLHLARGDLETAEAAAAEAMAIADRARIPNMRAAQVLGDLASRRGEHDLSERLLLRALVAPPPSPNGVQSTLELLAFTAAAQGRAHEAAWMVGACEALEDGKGPQNEETRDFERRWQALISELRTALGDARFERASLEGAALSFEEASRRAQSAFPTRPG